MMSISASVRLFQGRRHQPVEVGAGVTVYSAAAGDILERRSSSRMRLLLDLLRHARGLDLLAQLVVLALLVVAFAELLLDGLHLLAQVVLALVLLQLGLDLALDLVADLQDLQVLDQHLVEPLEPRAARRASPASPASGRWSGVGRLAAMKSARRLGSWMFAASVCSSSERVGRAPPPAGRGPARSGPGPCTSISCSGGHGFGEQLDVTPSRNGRYWCHLMQGGSAARPARPGAANRRGT